MGENYLDRVTVSQLHKAIDYLSISKRMLEDADLETADLRSAIESIENIIEYLYNEVM